MQAIHTPETAAAALMEQVMAALALRVRAAARAVVAAQARAILAQAIGQLGAAGRMAAEAARVARILGAAQPPAELAAAPAAPARGPVQLVGNWALLPGGTRRRDGSHGQVLDPLSQMCLRAAGRGTDAPPFTARQIDTARAYIALAERHAAAGVKGASAETRAVARGGGGGDFMAAYLAEGDRLRRIRAAIGSDAVLRPDRGRAAPVPALVLVDMVLLHGASLRDVLARHGWAKNCRTSAALRDAIGAAMDRAANA